VIVTIIDSIGSTTNSIAIITIIDSTVSRRDWDIVATTTNGTRSRRGIGKGVVIVIIVIVFIFTMGAITDNIYTASHTYVHVLSLCNLYPLPVT
jgi:uncharacterized protein Veg